MARQVGRKPSGPAVVVAFILAAGLIAYGIWRAVGGSVFGAGPIERVYFYSGEALSACVYDYHYRIDLRQLTVAEVDACSGPTIDTSLGADLTAEGYDLVGGIDAAAANDFAAALTKANVGSWREQYSNPLVLDGGAWEITVVYADGGVKQSRGDNAGPRGLWALEEAIYQLVEAAR